MPVVRCVSAAAPRYDADDSGQFGRSPRTKLSSMMTTQSPGAEKTILDVIRELLARRGAVGIEIRHESKLAEELGLDSLELSELSAALEDDLGRDPYTEGLVPETVGDLVNYYRT